MKFIYPQNYDKGDTFFNFIDKDKAKKGAGMAVAFTIIGSLLPIPQKYKTAVILILAVMGFGTGFVSVKGYTLSEYILILIAHRSNKHKLSYRPIRFRYFKSFKDIEKEKDEEALKDAKKQSKAEKAISQFRGKLHTNSDDEEDDERQPSKLSRWLDVNKPNIFKDQRYVQQFIPIEKIENGIIQLTNGKFIVLLQVMPVNFGTMDIDSQVAVLQNFYSWLSMMNGQAQCKAVTERVNMKEYIEEFQEIKAKETNEACRKFDDDYIRLIQEISANNDFVSHQFYLILSFEQEGIKELTDEEIKDKLWGQANLARNQLSRCGNIVNPAFDNNTVYHILYRLFNRKTYIRDPFEDRYKRVMLDTEEAYGQHVVEVSPNQLYAPRGIDMTHSDYVVMDGMYYTYFFIDGDSYPTEQHTVWIMRLLNLGEGFDVDLYIQKENHAKMVDKVTRKATLREVDLRQELTPEQQREISSAYYSAKYLEDGLTNGASKEDFFYFSIIVTISANTYKDLNRKRRTFKETMASLRMEAYECVNQEENGLLSVMPFTSLQPTLADKSKRNILTSGLISMYPFISYEMNDRNGVLFGVNPDNATLVMLNLFDTSKHMNANMFIVGTSGAGKSYSLMLLALRMRRMGIQVFIIAPLKGHEFRPSCEKIGGEYIDMSTKTINIMEIRETAKVDQSMLSGIDANVQDGSSLKHKITQLLGFMNLICPGLTTQEESSINVMLTELYKGYGITDEPGSYKDSQGNIKEMPTLKDFYDMLEKTKDDPLCKKLRDALSAYVSGTYDNFSGQTNVNLDNLYTVIDISTLDDKMLPVAMFVAMDYVYDIMKADVTQNNILFIDELWRLLKAGQSQTVKSFVLELFKIVRGYGGGAVAATQDISDMNNDEAGKGVISACPTKLTLRLESNEIKNLKKIMDLTDSDEKLLKDMSGRGTKGVGILWVNDNKVPISIKSSTMEHRLITTDASDLRKMKEEQEGAKKS